MNTSNPFQIPACVQANLQQRRRERFKKGVLVAVAGTTVLLAVLLILGCNSEHARAASGVAVASDVSAEASAAPEVPETRIDAVPNSSGASLVVALAPAPVVSKAGALVPAGRAVTFYVVKPADTLSRIAKSHGTTVKAVKVANGLESDRIGIGMKLKLPEV